jgi:hypothetical protein
MGSRAWASDQMADVLALTRELEISFIFMTMTANPAWPEIVSYLLSGQHYTDISSVVCWAFYTQLQYLKAFIKKYFRKLIYIVSVVEFQKQGLPHCHLLIKIGTLKSPNENYSLSDFFCFFRSRLSLS